MDQKETYFLLLCDVRKSSKRSVREGTALLNALEDVVQATKKQFPAEFALGPELNYGDEISALFSSPNALYDVMAFLRQKLKPIAGLRCVCIHGQIGAQADTMNRISGPIFKQANEAISTLKKSGWFSAWKIGDDQTNQTLSALANLIDARIQSMTDYQFEVYQLMASGLSQSEVAAQLGKYQQSVSDAVSRAHIDIVLEAETAMRDMLAGFRKD